MFGFGKKKAENSKNLDLTAGAALEILHNTQKEILDKLDAHLVS